MQLCSAVTGLSPPQCVRFLPWCGLASCFVPERAKLPPCKAWSHPTVRRSKKETLALPFQIRFLKVKCFLKVTGPGHVPHVERLRPRPEKFLRPTQPVWGMERGQPS